MRKTVEFAAVFVLAASLTMVGCAEPSPTMTSDDDGTSFFSTAPADGFDVLRRNTPLIRDVTVTRIVGPDGGRIELSEAGIALVIPSNALDGDVSITMTALAGDAAAVEFAPHGLEFRVPATMQVRAEGTHAADDVAGRPNGAALERFLGVYFEGDPETGADPLETIPTIFLDGAIVFQIEHFSGYATASG